MARRLPVSLCPAGPDPQVLSHQAFGGTKLGRLVQVSDYQVTATSSSLENYTARKPGQNHLQAELVSYSYNASQAYQNSMLRVMELQET